MNEAVTRKSTTAGWLTWTGEAEIQKSGDPNAAKHVSIKTFSQHLWHISSAFCRMEDNSLAQQYKLDVTVLGDRSREVFHAPTQCHDHGTAVKMWQRQRFLADNVYLEKAPSGELRVIKQMHWKYGKSHMAELKLMGRVTKVW